MKKLPFVTIVVIVLNMKNELYHCLKSIESLDYPRDNFEILVIDGGSNDGTLDICKNFDVKCIIEERKGRGLARNIGVKNAKGEIIAFIDADCKVTRNWLMVHARNHMDNHVGAVGGAIINPMMSISNKFALTNHYEYFAEFDGNTPKRIIYHVSTSNASFKKSTIEEAGFFDDNLDAYEDFELCNRITQTGSKIIFDPDAKVLHFGVNPTMSSYSFMINEIERAKAHLYAQISNQNIFGRLPMHRVSALLFTPSIVLSRIIRQIVKLKYSKAPRILILLPYIMMGGLIWGFTYVKEVFFR